VNRISKRNWAGGSRCKKTQNESRASNDPISRKKESKSESLAQAEIRSHAVKTSSLSKEKRGSKRKISRTKFELNAVGVIEARN
jgi:hypothetical protein